MNIEKYNVLTPDIAETPRYQPDPKNRCIRVYYAKENDVIIVGEADPCYIFWMSVTKIDDIEINQMIIHYISQLEPAVFGCDSIVVEKKTKYTYEQLMQFYTAQVERADDILTIYKEKKQRSKQREADKKLIQSMKRDLKALEQRSIDPRFDFERNRERIERIQSQDYLRVSDNPQVRELYEQLDKCCSKLYNAYMTEAH